MRYGIDGALAQGDPADVITACVESEMRRTGIHGAQLAVMDNGEMVYERAFGRKHRDQPDPVDVHTLFRIGSTTKTLSAVALLQLVDAGRLDLDAPITTYLTDFALAEPGQAERITTRHLLSHASGLHDTSALDESDLEGERDPDAMRRWVDAQKGQAPYAPPGRFWNYSSANYMYAGQILERISGKTYQEYMDDQVFAPARLRDSTLHAAEAVAHGNFAYGHFRNPFTGLLDIYTLDEANNWARHPTGYANSTAGDLVRIASLLMTGGGELLSSGSATEMSSRIQHRDLRDDQYYGLGTFIEYFDGNEMIHHDGGAWGWSATLKWIPSAQVAVATTSNVGGGLMQSSTACALRAYVAAGPDGPNNACRLNRDSWSDFAGTYSGSRNNGEPWTFIVTRPTERGNLELQLTRPGAPDSSHELTQDCSLWLSDGPGTFDAADLGRITFIRDPVEPELVWLRNRFFVGGMRRNTSSMATPTPDLLPTATTTVNPDLATILLPWLYRR